MFAQIAIPKTTLDTLTYSVPEEFNSHIKIGSLVKVPLRKKYIVGIVVELHLTLADEYQNYEIKNIEEVIQTDFLDKNLISLLSWVKKYYMVSWGQVISLTVPKEVLRISSKVKKSNNKNINSFQSETTDSSKPAITTPDKESNQNTDVALGFESGLRKISYYLKNNCFQPFLLFNNTAADLSDRDKIEFYLRMIEEAIKFKKSVIVLVPEVNIIPQFIAHFQSRLNDDFFCFHSALKHSERRRIWWQIHSRDFAVVLGTRSSIFAPVKNLGLIIVDNEQEISYKEQERHSHYNARDVALVRGQKSKAVVVLSSATPSCESFYNMQIKKYEPITLQPNLTKSQKSVSGQTILIDLRRSKDKIISFPLRSAIISHCRQNKRVLLFINRLGYARVLSCNDCGYIPLCSHCGVSLTFHREKKVLLCHVCQTSQPIFDLCPQCKGSDFFLHGFGSEKIESEVKKFINPNKVLRYDSDVQKSLKESINQLLHSRDIKVLVTTKLGVRNLDFADVNLVGIILADTTLFLPDFRAQERTFQETRQIIIRALHNKDAKVIIQSYHPDHPAIRYAVQANYKKFYDYEIKMRQKLFYPPFSRMALISISSNQKEVAMSVAEKFTKKLLEIRSNLNIMRNINDNKINQETNLNRDVFKVNPMIEVLGPTHLPRYKHSYRHTYQLLLKLNPKLSLSNLITRAEINTLLKKNTDIDVDIDPI